MTWNMEIRQSFIISKGFRNYFLYSLLFTIIEQVCIVVDMILVGNFVNGVVHALKENDASEMIVGLHEQRTHDTSFYGHFTENLVQNMPRQLTIVIINCKVMIITLN